MVSILSLVTGAALAGNLEPTAPPGPTMKTLDEIPPTWSQLILGAARFRPALGGGAFLDRETGLVWAQTPHTNALDWINALFLCVGSPAGGRKGWRLPTIEELYSLYDTTASSAPFLPPGHPFTNVTSGVYWSGTTIDGSPTFAFTVDFSAPFGELASNPKSGSQRVWCVRGASGHNGATRN